MSTYATDHLRERYHDTGGYRSPDPYYNRREESLFPNAIAMPLRRKLSGKSSSRRSGNRQTPGQQRSGPGKRRRQAERHAQLPNDPLAANQLRHQLFLEVEAMRRHKLIPDWLKSSSRWDRGW